MTNYTTLESAKKVKKETVFTQMVTWHNLVNNNTNPSIYKNVLHLGFDNNYGDVFKCWNNDKNEFYLFFGIKGSEFD